MMLGNNNRCQRNDLVPQKVRTHIHGMCNRIGMNSVTGFIQKKWKNKSQFQ